MTSVLESKQNPKPIQPGDEERPLSNPDAMQPEPQTTISSDETTFNRYQQIARWMTLLGYFGLLGLILNWFSWIAPPETVPRALPLFVLTVPLLFPLFGLLHGRVYTHAWVSLLALPYFAIGIDVAFNRSDQRWLGLAMVATSLAFFTGAVLYSYMAKRLRKLAIAPASTN